jgi:hypothetical protein
MTNWRGVTVTCSNHPSQGWAASTILLLSIFAFHAFTLRDGHHWGDDYASYVHHAKNIATGLPYADTGYIFDPYYLSYGLRVTPPVFPLLLAPVYAIFGMNFTALKMEGVAFFVAALAVLFALVRGYLQAPYPLLLLALIGFNPFFWNAKDDILSDIPFLFFVLLTALLVERRKSPLLCGLMVYLAIGTRAIGIVLLPIIVFHDLWRSRRMTKYTVTIVVTAIGCLLMQRIVLQDDAARTYGAMFHPTPSTLLSNVWNYRELFGVLWKTPIGWFSAMIYLGVFVIAVLGAPKQQPLFLAVLACFYAATLVIWPGPRDPRFLMPLFPIFLFFAVRGMQRLGSPATLVICLVLLAGYVLQYRTENFLSIAEANGRSTFIEMCSYVRSSTMPTDRIVFNRARSLSLFTDRPASPYHQPNNPEDLWRYFAEQNIRYVVVSSLFEKDQNVLVPMVELHKSDLDLTYTNPEFRVYRIRQ